MTQRTAGTPADIVIVGAGFAGLYMLHKARQLGLRARLFEAGDDVGGTWFWNRYPGARCDTESLVYSYSFSEELQQEWQWTERYAAQPEIQRYLHHVADRFALWPDIELETRVTAAHWDDDAARWTVTTDRGEQVVAQWCVMATGCLSTWQKPELPGSFSGPTFHTGIWPQEGVDFTGKRVAVIGTGSSGIQLIPNLAQQAAHVTVFQRTPNYSVPARNRPLDAEHETEIKQRYAAFREEARRSAFGVPFPDNPALAATASAEELRASYEERWERGGVGFLVSFADLLVDAKANETAGDFIRSKIREIVEDPATAEKLLPGGHYVGAKRLPIDIGYFEAFNRDNVSLVDLRESGIAELTPGGLRQENGAEHLFDALVYATGFDAMTGALLAIDIQGRDGLALRDAWADGPRAYLGLAIAGFPNLFAITAPGSPSVLSNMVVSIEQHVEWIADTLADLRSRGVERLEANVDAQERWVDHVLAVGDSTLFPKSDSWYTGSNIPGKKRIFMPYVGGVGSYRQECDDVRAAGYKGFLTG